MKIKQIHEILTRSKFLFTVRNLKIKGHRADVLKFKREWARIQEKRDDEKIL